MATPVHAAAEEAHGLIGKAQRNLPKIHQSTRGTGGHANQPNSSGLGELLCGRRFGSVLLVGQRLGGEEGKKVRRHLMRAQKRKGFGWKRWSKRWLYEDLKLFNNYRVKRDGPLPKVVPER